MNLLSLFRRPKPHEHDWFICYRQAADPPLYIADCACGARAKVYTSVYGLPDIRIEEPSAAGSIENALFDNQQSLLGDPQAERLKLLISEG